MEWNATLDPHHLSMRIKMRPEKPLLTAATSSKKLQTYKVFFLKLQLLFIFLLLFPGFNRQLFLKGGTFPRMEVAIPVAMNSRSSSTTLVPTIMAP